MPTTTASPVTLPGTVQQRVAAAAARAGVPVCFQSDPGQGKTATITAWLSAWGYQAEILSPANREPADFLGQMVLTQDGTTGHAPLSWAKRLTQTTRHAAVLLDEANLGAEDTMKALHRVLEEKVVGDLPLPKNTAMICTINPPSNATGAVELPAAVANRMLHLQWDMDFDAWAAGLVGGFDTADVPTLDSLAPGGSTDDLRREALMVSMFLRQKPELRNACPDTMAQAAGPWPSYRSWTKMVQVLACCTSATSTLVWLRSTAWSGRVLDVPTASSAARSACSTRMPRWPTRPSWTGRTPSRTCCGRSDWPCPRWPTRTPPARFAPLDLPWPLPERKRDTPTTDGSSLAGCC